MSFGVSVWSVVARLGAMAMALMFALTPARAVQPGEILNDARLEARARDISGGLRCLVCQNQSIDDSDAPLAHDLRVLVRERLQAGDSDAAVRGYIVARYGEYVLLKPPFGWHTLLLWLMPLLVLFGAVALARSTVAQGNAAENPVGERPLNRNEEARLKRILKTELSEGKD